MGKNQSSDRFIGGLVGTFVIGDGQRAVCRIHHLRCLGPFLLGEIIGIDFGREGQASRKCDALGQSGLGGDGICSRCQRRDQPDGGIIVRENLGEIGVDLSQYFRRLAENFHAGFPGDLVMMWSQPRRPVAGHAEAQCQAGA